MDVREKLVGIVERASVRALPKNTCHTNIVMLVNALIEEGVTVQEWISVKDRLPGKGTGHVLVVKQLRGKSYVDMGEVIGETACCYSDEYCINPREHIFTHWMPLPEPPKGE